MMKDDPEVLDALRKSRAAVKKLRSLAATLDEVGGWWGDVDGFLQGKFGDVASTMRGHAHALESDMGESYPRRGTTAAAPDAASKGPGFEWTPLHLRGGG